MLLTALLTALLAPPQGDPLPGTSPLELEGDIASQLVEGVDRFLLREIGLSAEMRQQYWQLDVSSHETWSRSLQSLRDRLAHILGVRDPRVSDTTPQMMASHACTSTSGDFCSSQSPKKPANAPAKQYVKIRPDE